MLKIEIETGNAAFCDPYTGEENRHFIGGINHGKGICIQQNKRTR